jgi:isopentenyldiphosphate isomerase
VGHDRGVSPLEPVEVIDDAGAVVGIVPRSVMRRDNLKHRAVYVAVCDTAGRLLVHQRSATKDLWPSRWDVAVGGVMAPGESWADGARRELAEEVGIDGPVALELLGDASFADADVDTVGRIYRVVSDGPFVFVDGEVVAAELVTADELARRLATDAFVPDSVAMVLPLLRPDSADDGGAEAGHSL